MATTIPLLAGGRHGSDSIPCHSGDTDRRENGKLAAKEHQRMQFADMMAWISCITMHIQRGAETSPEVVRGGTAQ